MKKLFHPKRITLITLLGIFVIGKCSNPKILENVVIPNYNGCKILSFTRKNKRAFEHVQA